MPSPSGGTLPAPGERLGPYLVERELGRGGMGAVFVARDAQGARVALKVVLSGDARFEVEGRTAGRLEHPNVVSVRAAGRDGARSWLAMELVDGEPLDARLRRGGPLEPRDAARWVAQAARGVEHAHARGVLHRDLKPANIIVDAQGVARVLDFGVARDARSVERLTQTGELVGTPAFMAPEQAGGERALDARVDVWGLGATLYCLLVGQPPFRGATTVNVITAILSGTFSAPRAERPALDPALEAIVLRCLRKDPAERPPSAAAVAEAFEAWSARADRPARSWAGWLLVGGGLLLLFLPLARGLLPAAPAPAPTTSTPPPSPTTAPPSATTAPPPPPSPTTAPPPTTRPPAPTEPEPEPAPGSDPPSIGLSSGPVDAKPLLVEPTSAPFLDLDLTAAGRARAPEELELREGWWATPRDDGLVLRTTLGQTAPRLRLPIARPTGWVEVWVEAEVRLLDEDTTFGAAVVVSGPRATTGAGLRLACALENQGTIRLREQPGLVAFELPRPRRSPSPRDGLATQPDGPTTLSGQRAMRVRFDPDPAGALQVRGFSDFHHLADPLSFTPGEGAWAIEVGACLPGLAVRAQALYAPAQVVEVLVRRVRVWGAQAAPRDDAPAAALGRAAWAQLARGDAAPLRIVASGAATQESREGAELLLALGSADPPGDASEREAAAALRRLAGRGRSPRNPPHPAELAASVSPERRALLARALGRARYADDVADGSQVMTFGGPPSEPPDDDWGQKALDLALEAARAPAAKRSVEERFGEGCVWYMAGDFAEAEALLGSIADAHPSAAGWAGLAALHARRPQEARRLWSRLRAPPGSRVHDFFDRYRRGLGR